MQELALSELGEQKKLAITGQIAFFNELHYEQSDQFNVLIEHSQLLQYSPGEVIITKDDTDRIFYSLIRGAVNVFPDKQPGDRAINQLSSGQLFGALATLNDEPRSATLTASSPDGAMVLATDLSISGKLHDFSVITLATKLSLYRNVVNNTRWKLQVFKNTTSDPTLEQELSLFKLFDGPKGTVEELLFLSEQCRNLASLLDSWNNVVEPGIVVPEMTTDTPLNRVMSFFRKATTH